VVRRLVGTLAVTQAAGYGVLFYTFAVFIAPIAAELHTSTTVVTGSFTLSVLVGAAVSVPVGRWIDKHGGRGLMTLGSALGAVAVLAWSQVRTVWQLYAVLVLIGLSSAAVLYDAAFAVIVKQVEPWARARSILLVTIVAGFSSTYSSPWAGYSANASDGAPRCSCWADLRRPHGGCRTLWRAVGAGLRHAAERNVSMHSALRDGGFWLLATAFTVNAAGITVIVVHLVGYHALARTSDHDRRDDLGVGRCHVGHRPRRVDRARQPVLHNRCRGNDFRDPGDRDRAAAAGRGQPRGDRRLCARVRARARRRPHRPPALLAERYGAAEFGSITGAIALPGALAKAAARSPWPR
jgi:hypothetical protein